MNWLALLAAANLLVALQLIRGFYLFYDFLSFTDKIVILVLMAGNFYSFLDATGLDERIKRLIE